MSWLERSFFDLSSLLRFFFTTLFFAIFLVFIFDLGFFSAKLVLESRDLSEIKRSDLVVVVTGGRGRIRLGLELLEKGYGEKLLISGVAMGVSLDHILAVNDLQSTPDYLKRRIILGYQSKTTPENTFEIRSFVEKTQAQSLILVTSNYHMPRAKKLLLAELNRPPSLKVAVEFFPVESPNFKKSDWYLNLTSWRLLFEEYIKSIPYRIDGKFLFTF